MPDQAPTSDAPPLSAQQLRRSHTIALLTIAALLTLTMLIYGWSVFQRQSSTLWWSLSSQGEQLQLALNDSIDVARNHVQAMRRTAERNLRQPTLADTGLLERLERRNLAPLRDAPWDRLPQDLVKEVGSVHVDPSYALDMGAYRRDLSAATGALAQVVAAHGQHKELLWSYFYNAQKQWRWVFPPQPRDDLLTATGTQDMSAALALLWDSKGLAPVEAAGPARNPQRELVWTALHTDPISKSAVASVLAPVYGGDSYLGTVGTDISMDQLGNLMVQRPLLLGHAWIVDADGQVLVDGDAASKTALPPGPHVREAGWLQFALRGTSWTLLIHAPARQITGKVMGQMVPFLALGVMAVLALVATTIYLGRRYTLPALQLAEYVEKAEGPSLKRPPPVPAPWKPWFDRVARNALQRRDRILGVHQHANQLETQLAQQTKDMVAANAEHETQSSARAAELRSVYAQLSAALADVQAAKGANPPANPRDSLPR